MFETNNSIDCFDYVSNAYVVYGSNVNTSRAFPSIYDGLKPVQRKIILASYEVSKEKEVGSANIVGYTISNYHPHGDCLIGSTQVLLSDYSINTVEELTNINKPQKVFSVDLKTGRIVESVAENFREVKKDNLWTIKFSDGGCLRCSGNHPILMRDKTYKKAEDLKLGDLVFSLEIFKDKKSKLCELEYTLSSVVEFSHLDDEIILYDFTVPGYENMLIKTSDNTLLCVHNSGVYKALVNMVNAEDPVISGHGAFGYKGGLVEIDAAHMRYTAAGLNKFGNSLFCEYINYVEKEENELYNMEQKYLPTPIPYALLNGSVGIGLGATTNIPACTVSSIEKWIASYLKNNDDSKLIIPKYTFVENKEELKSFNETGTGTFIFYAKVEKQKDKSIIVSDIPIHIQPNRLLKEFKVELQSRLVTIIQLNDEKNNPIIKIEKAPHVRSINVDEIFERTKKCMTKSISFKSVVTDGKKAYIFSPRNWLKFTVDNYKSFVIFGLKRELESLEEAILYNKVKKELADLFLQKKTNEEILQYFADKNIHIKESSLLKWSKKAISTLRADEVPVETLLSKMQEIKSNLININDYTLNKVKGILKISNVTD